MIARAPCPRCRSQGGDSTGDNLAMFDDGHMYCFACKYYERSDYYENSVDTTNENVDSVDIGEEQASEMPVDRRSYPPPWKPQKTQDDNDWLGDACDGSPSSHPRSSRNTGTEEANAFICFYRDRHKNKT